MQAVAAPSKPFVVARPSPARRWRQGAAAAAVRPDAFDHEEQPSCAASRRVALVLLAAGAAALSQQPLPAEAANKVARDTGDWSSPGLGAPVDPDAPKFFKTPSGVRVQLLAEGSGPAAAAGDVVLIDFVLRRSNGYFIYGTPEGVSFQPRDVPVGPVALPLGDGSVIAGLEEVITGLRAGTKFRALIPPELGYQAAPGSLPKMPTFATQRQLTNHQSEPLLFEVQLLRVGGVK